MSLKKIKLQHHHDETYNKSLKNLLNRSYFVEYTINGDIYTYSGEIRDIQKILCEDIGKGKFSLYHEKI
tara:strand:- start:82 stop:288 length:207 start_codon:yes stop_codon:yes gene_type:complete